MGGLGWSVGALYMAFAGLERLPKRTLLMIFGFGNVESGGVAGGVAGGGSPPGGGSGSSPLLVRVLERLMSARSVGSRHAAVSYGHTISTLDSHAGGLMLELRIEGAADADFKAKDASHAPDLCPACHVSIV